MGGEAPADLLLLGVHSLAHDIQRLPERDTGFLHAELALSLGALLETGRSGSFDICQQLLDDDIGGFFEGCEEICLEDLGP